MDVRPKPGCSGASTRQFCAQQLEHRIPVRPAGAMEIENRRATSSLHQPQLLAADLDQSSRACWHHRPRLGGASTRLASAFTRGLNGRAERRRGAARRTGGNAMPNHSADADATAHDYRIAARIERLPLSTFHLRIGTIIGSSWFFDGFDALAIAYRAAGPDRVMEARAEPDRDSDLGRISRADHRIGLISAGSPSASAAFPAPSTRCSSGR